MPNTIPQQDIKVFIGTATPGTLESETADCLELLRFYSGIPMQNIMTTKTEGVYTFRQQNLYVQQALQAGCTHVLLVENDMVFPKDTLARLLAHNLDIVACDYPIKYKRGKCKMMAKDANLQTINDINDLHGLHMVRRAPTGLMLIKTSVFTKLPYRKWFAHDWVDNVDDGMGGKGDYMGNDIHFNELCWANNIDTWVDYDLSKEVEHIGKRAFTYRDCV